MSKNGKQVIFPLLPDLPAIIDRLPVFDARSLRASSDWLVDDAKDKSGLYRTADGRRLVLANGLVARQFAVTPNGATVSISLLQDETEFVRAVKPEARIEINGHWHDIGGLRGQPVANYLDNCWLATMDTDAAAFQLQKISVGETVARFPWRKRLEWMPRDLPWPPPGKRVTFFYGGPVAGLDVAVHYEIYDGLPLVSKWLTLRNESGQTVRLNRFVCEMLAAVEAESCPDNSPRWRLPAMTVETDYTFCGMSGSNHGAAVHWVDDPDYATQVNYLLATPCLLECRPPLGPDQDIPPHGKFESFHVFELFHDSDERERQTLGVRRMYRAIAPWVTENPVLMHVRSAEPQDVRLAIDQCADVGFQMVIMTFGSGFDFESRDAAYQGQIRELAAYARRKGVALGGYSLLASRGAATDSDNTRGVAPRFGVMPCLGAAWGMDYLSQLRRFMENTGLEVLEHDGSYPGDLCAATDHPFHRGLDDSQWVMWRAITGLYMWCRGRGVYLNIPDWYFMNGGSKVAMGYRETNWSLPRAYQEVIERQNIYDGTWDKTPSMGWMFVPLTEYHGGGAAATIEPLQDHLAHYEQRLANLFGAGVQACYRGPRLYDTPATRMVVKRWVDFYKRHLEVLNGDIIHLRRATGNDWDGWLHVNAHGVEQGLAMLYNPLEAAIEREIVIPLYYTGLRKEALLSIDDGAPQTVPLNGRAEVRLQVRIAGRGWSWLVFSKP